MSIEKEVFPYMARDGQLHVMNLDGFWADVGQPKDFLIGSSLYLASLNTVAKSLLADPQSYKSSEIAGSVMIHESATIGTGCKIGPSVVIGPNCKIGDGVRLSNCQIQQSRMYFCARQGFYYWMVFFCWKMVSFNGDCCVG